MLTNFGNLFITLPRHAESADTRLGINKHDVDEEGRRKKERSEEGPAAATDDSATVTVEALRIFLENFLQTLNVQKTDGLSETSESIARPAASNVDGYAAKAASVYKHVAQGVEAKAPPVAIEQQPSAQPDIDLASDDVRKIHQLLADLKPITAAGVEYLTIERNDSFLNSLVAAVDKARASL